MAWIRFVCVRVCECASVPVCDLKCGPQAHKAEQAESLTLRAEQLKSLCDNSLNSAASVAVAVAARLSGWAAGSGNINTSALSFSRSNFDCIARGVWHYKCVQSNVTWLITRAGLSAWWLSWYRGLALWLGSVTDALLIFGLQLAIDTISRC